MRVLRNLLIGLVFIIALAVGAAYLLPREVIVERDTLVNAAPEEVYPHIASLQAFAEWSPWGDYDPDMQVTYSGADDGVGNVMEWTSDHPNVGIGRQEIIEVVENEMVRTALQFDGTHNAEAWWQLTPEGDGTRVTWGLASDMGMNPIGRWMGLVLERFVGPDYERGLEQLRETVES